MEIENTTLRNDLFALQKAVSEDNDMDGSGEKGGHAAKQLIGNLILHSRLILIIKNIINNIS